MKNTENITIKIAPRKHTAAERATAFADPKRYADAIPMIKAEIADENTMNNEIVIMYIIVSTKTNSWARGKTLEEAKRNFKKFSGGRITHIRKITGDEKPYISGMGELITTGTVEKILN
jgi:hypothetical protein